MALAIRRGRAALVVAAVVLAASVPAHAAPSRGGKCSPRKGACPSTVDSTPPSISIGTPSTGAEVGGTVLVAGTASDDGQVATVETSVDGGPFRTASGTTSWSFSLDTTVLADGTHTVTGRAVDGSGNESTAMVVITISNASPGQAPSVLTNPAVGDALFITGRGRMASLGSLSLLVYQESGSNKPWAFVRDASSGATSHVALPFDQWPGGDWAYATYVLTPDRELWVFSGGGPVYARRYQLTGSPLPTSATLVSTTTFGDRDSRAGDLTRLASGALVAVWHQQGETGPQGQRIAYRSASGVWSTVGPLTFMPTAASVQAVVQHPADGSIWLFSGADGWGAVGAAHLTEAAEGARLDWTEPIFIDLEDGIHDADPERPDVEVAPDPSGGTVVVAYQSAVRRMFSTSPVVTGSHVAVARVTASGVKSFTTLPAFVERISQLGLAVVGDATWLAYRPVDEDDLTFDDLYVSRHRGGSWSEPQLLGRLYGPYDSVAFGAGSEFAARLSDAKVHHFVL